MKHVCENIKKFRELKNLTREHVAAELDMSVSGYSKIERGETDINLSKLERIADVLGVEVGQILNFDASQIFNITNNTNVQAGMKANNVYYGESEVLSKYIRLLELEIERLKAELELCKKDK
jgi:transcriptional regulator with XRE-family HTH domain